MRSLTRLFVAALSTSLLALPGCKVESQGEAGALTFAYRDADQLLSESLESALAQGTRARVQVDTAGGAVQRITSAQIDAESVARVVAIEGSVVIIEGVAPGAARLTVAADGLEDRVAFTVAAPDSTHLRALGDATLVLTGGTEAFSVERKAGGASLVGEAALPSVAIEPAEGAARVDGPDHRVLLQYGAPGEVAVGADSAAISRTVVPLDRAARFELLPTDEDGAELPLSRQVLVGVQLFDAAGAGIGALRGVLTIEAADPTVCAVETGDYLGIEGAQIRAEGPGECALTVRVGTLETTLTYTFIEAQAE